MIVVLYFSVTKISFVNSFITSLIPSPVLHEILKYLNLLLTKFFIVFSNCGLLAPGSSLKFPTIKIIGSSTELLRIFSKYLLILSKVG